MSEFVSMLYSLTNSDKVTINHFTMMAGENKENAELIVDAVQNYIKQVKLIIYPILDLSSCEK